MVTGPARGGRPLRLQRAAAGASGGRRCRPQGSQRSTGGTGVLKGPGEEPHRRPELERLPHPESPTKALRGRGLCPDLTRSRFPHSAWQTAGDHKAPPLVAAAGGLSNPPPGGRRRVYPARREGLSPEVKKQSTAVLCRKGR